MLQENVLRRPSENILKLRELTARMTEESSERKSSREIIDQIAGIVEVEPKTFLVEADKLKFYEKMCAQIKKILSNI
jgi:hypothetical protein